jgi:hypothetical protein
MIAEYWPMSYAVAVAVSTVILLRSDTVAVLRRRGQDRSGLRQLNSWHADLKRGAALATVGIQATAGPERARAICQTSAA